MFGLFQSNESQTCTVAEERLTEDSKEILRDTAARQLQDIVNSNDIYCPAYKFSALHNTLNQLKSVYSVAALEKGIWIYGPYHYQRQPSGRFEVITKN